MANTTWSLSKDLQKQTADVISALRGELEELRGLHEEKSESERWAESDRANDVETWISSWESWIDDWEALEEKV